MSVVVEITFEVVEVVGLRSSVLRSALYQGRRYVWTSTSRADHVAIHLVSLSPEL